MSNNTDFIKIKNVSKSFNKGKIVALDDININIKKGEFVALMGPSGSGKSTLMNMIGALDKPDSGEIIIDGKELHKQRDLSKFRAEKLGFIFQLHNLITVLSASENVQIPMFATTKSKKKRKQKAEKLLKEVGLGERVNNITRNLSGGERQRVAIARALVNDPEVLIADEPTGSLDSKSVDEVLKLLQKIHKEEGCTIIMVTHDDHVASFAEKTLKMLDGKIDK